ncbi:T-cell surface glycoprotein CD8 beta chain-like [Astyanax mexicanus]|uniref:T-cell surface glycoprotein CD8 beta chain-like n=1 Tax=Astyanax mexicanus TaxID=7994 RepID=A0A8B9RM69_ASTMX|nr:T-cell surface glycoprotein CD8 beta chain-like [Astyanax mexicanus]
MFAESSGLLVLLLLICGGSSEVVKDGDEKEIVCNPKESGPTVFWFHLKENGMMEFIGAFTPEIGKKKTEVDEKKYNIQKMKENKLTLNSFNKKEDSGSYICMVIKGATLHFGQVVKLQGTPDPVQIPTPIQTTTAAKDLTTKQTVLCEKSEKGKTTPSVSAVLGCELMILIPLAAGSGLLLIALIITILYCNHIRTRRCPHHYKRHHQNRPAGHRPLPNKAEFYPM